MAMSAWGSSSNRCDNATYDTRIDNPDAFNFCVVRMFYIVFFGCQFMHRGLEYEEHMEGSPNLPPQQPSPRCPAHHPHIRRDTFKFPQVPNSGVDAVFFAALAIITACVLHFSRLSAVLVLIVGGLWQALLLPINLGRIGNAFALWLGIDPPEVFLFIFLPPLLLDSALTLDWFLFKKLSLQIFSLAFLVVVLGAALATPVLLYGLRLVQSGWLWQHAALFSAVVSATDAIAIGAVLHQAAGPTHLLALLEGESLLNDASALTIFELLRHVVVKIANEGDTAAEPFLQFLPSACAHLCVLSFGGAGLGLAAGFCFRRLLRLLRWHGASVAQEAAAIVSLAYLTYYAAEAMLHVSGVLAVVAFGLYGNAQGYFGLGGSARMPEFRAVQQTVAFALNGLVFFFAGASSVNFLYRAALTLRAASINFALFPLIYAMFLLARGISISCINWGLMRCFGAALLTRGEVVFTTFAGLRGAISLIMAQALLTDDLLAGSNEPFASQVGLWTALMVLSTLIVNAPLVPAALKATGLVHVTPLKRQIRGKCKRALARFTSTAIESLKQQDDEMLRGVSWAAVEEFVSIPQSELPEFSFYDETDETTCGSAADGNNTATNAARDNAFDEPRNQPTWHLQEETIPGSASYLPVKSSDPHATTTSFSTTAPGSPRALLGNLRRFSPHASSFHSSRGEDAVAQGNVTAGRQVLGVDRNGVHNRWQRAMVESPRASGSAREESPFSSQRRPRRHWQKVRFAVEDHQRSEGEGDDGHNDDDEPKGVARQVRSSSSSMHTGPKDTDDDDGRTEPLLRDWYLREGRTEGERQEGERERQPRGEREDHEDLHARGDLERGGEEIVEGAHNIANLAVAHPPSHAAEVEIMNERTSTNFDSLDMPLSSVASATSLQSSVPSTGAMDSSSKSGYESDDNEDFDPEMSTFEKNDDAQEQALPSRQPQSRQSTGVSRCPGMQATEVEDIESGELPAEWSPMQAEDDREDAPLLMEQPANRKGTTMGGAGGSRAAARRSSIREDQSRPWRATAEKETDAGLESSSPRVEQPRSSRGQERRRVRDPIHVESPIQTTATILENDEGDDDDDAGDGGHRDAAAQHGAAHRPGGWNSFPETLHHSFSTPLLTPQGSGRRVRSYPDRTQPPAFDLREASFKSMPARLYADLEDEKRRGGSASLDDERIHPQMQRAERVEGEEEGVGSVWSEEALAETRRRLLAGIHHYFEVKRSEGLLTAEGLRCVTFAVNQATDNAHQPLDLWRACERATVGGWLVGLTSRLFLATKQLSGALPSTLRPFLLPPLRKISAALGLHLSRVMLVACECAVETALAMTMSPAAEWLRQSQPAPLIQEEMANETQRATLFIIDREIEAPQRFQAIQTHRAALAVLRRQIDFIEGLRSAGVLDASERDVLRAPVDRRVRRLELRGPFWKAPSVRQVLLSLPFLAHAPPEMFELVMSQGRLKSYAEGDVLRSSSGAGYDVHVVVYGVVRSTYRDHRGIEHAFYLGSGGVLGLLPALLGFCLPGAGAPVAQADALHKGPQIFVIPHGVVETLLRGAKSGNHTCQQLECDMFRVAGLQVMERLRQELLSKIETKLCDARHGRRHRGHRQKPSKDKGDNNATPVQRAEAAKTARRILGDIRRSLRDAEVLRLAPGAQHVQRETLVLLSGSLCMVRSDDAVSAISQSQQQGREEQERAHRGERHGIAALGDHDEDDEEESEERQRQTLLHAPDVLPLVLYSQTGRKVVWETATGAALLACSEGLDSESDTEVPILEEKRIKNVWNGTLGLDSPFVNGESAALSGESYSGVVEAAGVDADAVQPELMDEDRGAQINQLGRRTRPLRLPLSTSVLNMEASIPEPIVTIE